jgi:hypothetical protein
MAFPFLWSGAWTLRQSSRTVGFTTCDGQHAARLSSQRRVRLFFLGFAGASAAVQKAVVPRFAAAIACPRAEPAAALAPLNHMLRKGFFFVHGFFMSHSVEKSVVQLRSNEQRKRCTYQALVSWERDSCGEAIRPSGNHRVYG